MANRIRSIQLRILGDTRDATLKVEQLNKAAAEASKARKIAISVDDTEGQKRLFDLRVKLDKLSKTVASPKIQPDDKAGQAKLLDLKLKLERLNSYVASPKISLAGADRTEARLLAIAATAERLSGQDINLNVNTRGGLLGTLQRGSRRVGGAVSGGLRGAVGAVGSAGSAIGSGIAAAGPIVGGVGLGLGGVVAASLVPALAPVVVGAGTALGGLFAAALLHKGFAKKLGGLGDSLKKDLQIATEPIVKAFEPLIPQIEKFAQSMRGPLTQAFRASTPFLRSFVQLTEFAAKTILPALTQVMRQLVSSGALKLLTQGLEQGIKGIAAFAKNLGPGMRPSAQIFLNLMKFLGSAMGVAGKALALLSIGVLRWGHNIHVAWDDVRHATAVFAVAFVGEFDRIRHLVAHDWDVIFQSTIGTVIRLGHNVETQTNSLKASIVSIYGTIRRDIANAWSSIWVNTVGRVRNGIGDVVRFFAQLPGRVLGALRGLGHSLFSFGHEALNDLWSGFKSVAGSIFGWIKNFISGIPHALMKILHMSPPHPGSVFFDLGANFMHHLESGIKSKASSVMGSIGGAIQGTFPNLGGLVGGSSAASVKSLAQQMFPWPMSMFPAFDYVEMREAGYNLRAVNPGSGAYGIAQFINGPGEYFQYGGNPTTAAGQLVAMFRYIAQRYGNPLAAAAHEQRFNWYSKGTEGAKRGWAWVGEKGPELINLHGGETVLDAQTSRKLTGYAGGTESGAIADLLRRIAGITLHTTDKSLETTRDRLLTLVGKHFSGPAETRRESMLARQVTAMETIRDHLHNLNARIARERSYQHGVMSSLSGTGALSGLTLGPTAGVGDNVALSGGQGLTVQLRSKLGTLRRFASALKRLHQLHLPNSLFRQVVGLGPDQGLDYANELISGGPAFIRQLSGLERSLTHEERLISQGAASTIYQGRFNTGRQFTLGLQHERHHLEREFRHLGRVLGEEAVRWFRVPRGKRRGFAAGGVITEPILGFGPSGMTYTLAENGPELVTPMHSGYSGGGDTYITITVAGDNDPDQAAMRIMQKINNYNRRHGRKPAFFTV